MTKQMIYKILIFILATAQASPQCCQCSPASSCATPGPQIAQQRCATPIQRPLLSAEALARCIALLPCQAKPLEPPCQGAAPHSAAPFTRFFIRAPFPQNPCVSAGTPPCVSARTPPCITTGAPPSVSTRAPPCFSAGAPPCIPVGAPPCVQARTPPCVSAEATLCISAGVPPYVSAGSPPCVPARTPSCVPARTLPCVPAGTPPCVSAGAPPHVSSGSPPCVPARITPCVSAGALPCASVKAPPQFARSCMGRTSPPVLSAPCASTATFSARRCAPPAPRVPLPSYRIVLDTCNLTPFPTAPICEAPVAPSVNLKPQIYNQLASLPAIAKCLSILNEAGLKFIGFEPLAGCPCSQAPTPIPCASEPLPCSAAPTPCAPDLLAGSVAPGTCTSIPLACASAPEPSAPPPLPCSAAPAPCAPALLPGSVAPGPYISVPFSCAAPQPCSSALVTQPLLGTVAATAVCNKEQPHPPVCHPHNPGRFAFF